MNIRKESVEIDNLLKNGCFICEYFQFCKATTKPEECDSFKIDLTELKSLVLLRNKIENAMECYNGDRI